MSFLKKIGGLVLGAVGAVVGFVASGGNPAFAAIGFSVGMGIGSAAQMAAMDTKVPDVSSATAGRLNVSIDPDATRKIAFGETALGTDQVYWETFGAENSSFDQVIAAAGHEIESFGDLYFDDEKVTFSGDNATGDYAGALSKQDRTVGVTGTALSVGAGSKWTSNCSLTGIAHYALKINWSQEKYPRGIPNRVTRVGKGALVYDPRRDSTVPGGSGSHRADDQSTWEYTPTDSNGEPIGRNPALQILWYEIGWRVQNPSTSEWILVCGRGRPLDDIDFESFITAANDCEDEEYYSDVLLSTGDAHETNIAVLEAACAGKLMDPGGRVSLRIRTDTTGDIVQAFTDHDVLDTDAADWIPKLPLSQRWNQAVGSFPDPRGLYRLVPLPVVRDTTYETEDGFKKPGPAFRFDAVQDPDQAQKLMRLELNMSRYQGVFTAPFNWRAKKVRVWDCVTLTFPRLGFATKIFRVIEKKTDPMGAIWLLLREDDPSVYTPGTVTPVPAPAAGAGYDPRIVTSPSAGDWTLTPSYIEGGGAKIPKLGISGTVPASNIVAVHLYFRQGVSGDWILQGRYTSAGTVRSERTSIALNTSYYARIVYENAYGVLSAPTDIGPYTSPADFEALTAQIADGFIGQGWGATASEAAASNAVPRAESQRPNLAPAEYLNTYKDDPATFLNAGGSITEFATGVDNPFLKKDGRGFRIGSGTLFVLRYAATGITNISLPPGRYGVKFAGKWSSNGGPAINDLELRLRDPTFGFPSANRRIDFSAALPTDGVDFVIEGVFDLSSETGSDYVFELFMGLGSSSTTLQFRPHRLQIESIPDTADGPGDWAPNHPRLGTVTDFADVTGDNNAAGFDGQGALATKNSISTSDIIADAVTSKNSYSVDGAISLIVGHNDPTRNPSTTEATYISVVSKTVTTSGGTVLVLFNAVPIATTIGTTYPIIYARIKRGSTIIRPEFTVALPIFDGAGGAACGGAFSAFELDTPSSGSHTYSLEIRVQHFPGTSTPLESGECSSRAISLLEFKK